MTRGRSLLIPLALALALASCSAPHSPAGAAQTTAVPRAATDNPAAPGEQATPSPSATEGQETAVAPTPGSASAAAPALALATELPWAPVYAGDPLRVLVRLSSPRAMDALYVQYLATEAGQPTPPADSAAPAIPADWAQGVTLTLERLEAGGARRAVLAGDDWAPHLRRKGADLPTPGLLVWSQEWLVPADVAQLQEGEYALTALWNGEGHDGTVEAAEVRFAAGTPANEAEKAVNAGRLAYCAYARGDYVEAYTRGLEALDTGVEDFAPERFDTYFLVAGAALGLKDDEAAIATYERIIALAPEGHDLALLAQQWIDIVKEIQAGS